MSLVQGKMREIQLRMKYFPSLNWIEVRSRNQVIRQSMRIKDFSALLETVVSNNVKSLEDIERLTPSTKQAILSKVVDEVTFNRLIKTCWSLKHNPKPGNHLQQLQHINYELSKIYNPY